MHTPDFQKIAALPLVQDAIRKQAEAIEAESLAARLAILDAYQQTADALANLDAQRDELDARQDELDAQRDELAKQRAAHAIERQGLEAEHRKQARELRGNHGSELAATIGRMLGGHAFSLRREAEYQCTVRDRKPNWMGDIIEKPSPEAMRKADELERRAEQIEQERDAIMALQFARVSPQAIERDVRARVNALGFNLNTTTEKAGWNVEGWEGKPKTKAA